MRVGLEARFLQPSWLTGGTHLTELLEAGQHPGIWVDVQALGLIVVPLHPSMADPQLDSEEHGPTAHDTSQEKHCKLQGTCPN